MASLPAVAAELSVRSSDASMVQATINGVPVRLRVDPETSDYVILNPAAAARLKLKPSLLRAESIVGPVKIKARSKSATLSINGTPFRKRIVWPDRQVVDGADGLIGPAGIPFDRVTFHLSQPASAEREYKVPLKSDGLGIYAPFAAGEQEIRVQFSLLRPDSIATASAGAVLAARHDGTWEGAAVTRHIKYGVSRPARVMRLALPVSLSGLSVDRLMVRTADHRGSFELPAETSNDPEEIVVSAAVSSRQRAYLSASIGLDVLSTCSSLVYDRHPGTLTLRCA